MMGIWDSRIRREQMAIGHVQLVVPDEVKDFVTDQGIESTFQDLLDHLPDVFPEASRVECEFDPGIEDESDPVVIFGIYLPPRGPSDSDPFMKWSAWALSRHSGRELYHFTVLFSHES